VETQIIYEETDQKGQMRESGGSEKRTGGKKEAEVEEENCVSFF